MSDIDHICLADDGKLKAVYSDHDVLVLSPRGGMFAYISGQDVVRQHCAFVVSKYADRLCAALAFRNMHLDSIVWVSALEKTHLEQKFTLGYPLSYVRWSASKEAAEAADCLQTVSDGRISLKSEEETARLVLHPHGRRFAVCFPLLVGKTQDEKSALTYHYVWQTQVFATADFPQRWEYPLKLALSIVHSSTGQETGQNEAAKALQGETSTAEPELKNTAADIIQQVTAIMIGPYASEARNEEQDKKEEAESEAPEPDIIQRTTHLPQASQPAFEDPKFLEENSWWTEPTGQQAPTKEVIQVRWTPDLFMQFVPSLREVHAWLTRDESFLATSDKGAFVKHQTAPKFESLYRSSGLPVHAWSADGTGRYDFQPLGQAVLKLRQQSMDVLERRAIEADAAAAAAARVQQPVKSSEIKAKQTVRDLGVFTAFEDGRIRVRFADRTIVAIDRWHRFAEVVHRDSTTGTVSVSAPHGATEYVKAAMEFGNWVFKSDEEKDLARAAKRAVVATANANERMALLCEYAVTEKLPEEIAGLSQHAEHTLPQMHEGAGEPLHVARVAGLKEGSGRGSPAELATSQTGFAARDARAASIGVRSSFVGPAAVHAVATGATDGPVLNRQIDFAAAGRFGMGGEAGMPHASVLHTPALKRTMQSHHAQHTAVHASLQGPLVPDPPTILPTATDFGARGGGVRGYLGRLDDGAGGVGSSLSFRNSPESFVRSSFGGAAEHLAERTATARTASAQHARPGDLPGSSIGGGLGTGTNHHASGMGGLAQTSGFRAAGGAPPFSGAVPPAHSGDHRHSVTFTPLRGGGPGLSGVSGFSGRAAMSGNVGVGGLPGSYIPGKAGASGAAPGAYSSRVDELEAEFASTKENVEVPGLSFNGDRESVVEQWLKRNQQILAGLELDS